MLMCESFVESTSPMSYLEFSAFFAEKRPILNSTADLMHYRGPARWLAMEGYDQRLISYRLMLFLTHLYNSEQINI